MTLVGFIMNYLQSINKPKCDPACYTNGKGCIQSPDGRCIHLTFANKGFSIRDYFGKQEKKPKQEKVL